MADRTLVDERLANVLRDERGRLTASLVRILGDWDVAEELVQDAAIAALEPFDRGCYAGPGGWVDHRGDGEWGIALRGATLDGRRAHLLAGAGIVPGSDADAEWAETEHKLAGTLELLLGP